MCVNRASVAFLFTFSQLSPPVLKGKKRQKYIIQCYINKNKLSLWGSVSNLSKHQFCDLKKHLQASAVDVFSSVFLTKLMVSHKCFTTQFPRAHFQRKSSLITYANKNRHPHPPHDPLFLKPFPKSHPARAARRHALPSPVYHCVLFSLLPQILFHCKMMPISKASRRWLWSGFLSVPAGKVIWVGSYFQPVMLPGILQGAATVL